MCSEKSIAAYIILESLYRKGIIGRKPLMILSSLMTENTSSEPHVFIILENEQDNYPTKYMLYDIENPTLIEDKEGNKHNFIGLYSLTDEQYNNILKGIECTPISIFELMQPELHDISDKRIYGSSSTISLK